MEPFAGKLAVVTGGGGGIGRELCVQLARAGCSVAALDLNADSAAETAVQARAAAPPGSGVRATAHAVDVTREDSLEAARDEVLARHATDRIGLLFNNAGIAGAGSFLTDPRDEWEKVFDVCWLGVYYGSRVFLPLLVASPDECVIVNTASINAFWPTHGAGNPGTSYGAAKFAVKGFSEALIEDLRTHAPHVRVAVVMPGGVGTGIGANSARALGRDTIFAGGTRGLLTGMGAPVEHATEEQLARVSEAFGRFGPRLGIGGSTAEEAARTILDGVREGRWRILVGRDAERLDRLVRHDPEHAYDPDGTSPMPSWLLLLATAATFLDAGSAPSAAYSFVFGDEPPVAVRVGAGPDGGLEVGDPAPDPDAVVHVRPGVFRELLTHRLGVEDAVAAGDLRVEGDLGAVTALIAAVAVP